MIACFARQWCAWLLKISFCFVPVVSFAQLSPIESAEQNFTKGKYDEATKGFQGILSNPFATPRDIALSQCRLGIIASIKNDNKTARKNLEDAIRGNALAKNVSTLCQYALLQMLVIDNDDKAARDLITRMGDPAFSPLYIARIWALAAEVAFAARLG